jgi:hypothetical protein
MRLTCQRFLSVNVAQAPATQISTGVEIIHLTSTSSTTEQGTKTTLSTPNA